MCEIGALQRDRCTPERADGAAADDDHDYRNDDSQRKRLAQRLRGTDPTMEAGHPQLHRRLHHPAQAAQSGKSSAPGRLRALRWGNHLHPPQHYKTPTSVRASVRASDIRGASEQPRSSLASEQPRAEASPRLGQGWAKVGPRLAPRLGRGSNMAVSNGAPRVSKGRSEGLQGTPRVGPRVSKGLQASKGRSEGLQGSVRGSPRVISRLQKRRKERVA
jgi:hypothetical protein